MEGLHADEDCGLQLDPHSPSLLNRSLPRPPALLVSLLLRLSQDSPRKLARIASW